MDKSRLQEGCWNMPNTVKEATRLLNLMQQPLPKKYVGDGGSKNKELGIGDDQLFDNLSKLDPEMDARPIIQAFIQNTVLPEWDNYSYATDKGNYKGERWEKGVKEIFQAICDMHLRESIQKPDVPELIKYTVNKYRDDAHFQIGMMDEEIQHFTDGTERYEFTISGGLNGPSLWDEYFAELSKVFQDLYSTTKWFPVVDELVNDVLDDVFYLKVVLYNNTDERYECKSNDDKIKAFNKKLQESIIKDHDELNSKLWDPNTKQLLPEVRQQILKIAKFIKDSVEEDLGFPVVFRDLFLVGSMAGYNYTPKSDIDLHIIVQDDKSNDMLFKLLNYIKTSFNKKYPITIKDIPIEVNFELDTNITSITNGIYSVRCNKWLQKPIKSDLEITIEPEAMNNYSDAIDTAINSDNIHTIDDTLARLYALRKQALAQGGEKAEGNLLFKQLRDQGQIKDLKDKRNDLIVKELSLGESFVSMHSNTNSYFKKVEIKE